MRNHTTLLLVDDENNLRQVLARVLELEGYQVLQAKNAREGFELLENHAEEVEVVLSDVKLPADHGLNILRKVKEKYPLPDFSGFLTAGSV
ncbi:response regulator receiver domain-containing protein [Pontibacter ummariensis]|uniref:Response regulator receiver domain-containing protein n=1 Tax=Pontibacter ummariensis TaxID=1610492 RepID=A0A239FXC3_9BACT|nr:response regulator [Pontibacter ummariensis]PRY11885.1 response regulator receiver domain-containing protein [Pontibacter ummariensis]SNS61395.1 Response regulator receiver domain-containing protein [Pontibacter ummariensis]